MKKILVTALGLFTVTAADTYAQGVSGMVSNIAQEKQFSANVYLELEHDDNIRKTNTNEESDIQQLVGVAINYTYISKALDMGIGYALTHEEYADDSFEGKTRLEGNARVQISTNPARYSWLIQHDQSIGNSNNRNADTPNNLEQRSVLTTGPNVNLQLSRVDTLSATFRYVDVRFDEQSNNDTQREQAQLSWNHLLSPRSNVGLTASYVEVEGDTPASGYNQQKFGLTYVSQIKYGSYSLSGGQTKLERDVTGIEDTDGSYYSASFNTTWSGSSLGFSANRDVTDSSIGLSQSFSAGSGFQNGDTNFDNIDIVTRTRYQIFYNRRNVDGRLGMSAQLARDEQSFDTLLTDQESQSASIAFDYALSQNLNTSVSYRYEKNKYLDEPLLGEDKAQVVSLGLDHSVGQQWSFSYSISYDERENSIDVNRDYQSLRTAVRVNYQFR
jgi:hypothetical protein